MSPRTKIDTLIVSDVHLGSLVSRASELNNLLRTFEFKRLIILGDLFDGLNFNRLDSHSWELLSRIRDLSSAKYGREVIWIRGNHDKNLADMMSRLVGTQVFDEYTWEFKGKRFLAIHGDIFDTFYVRKMPLLARVARFFFLLLQNFDKESRHIVKFIERSHTSWMRVSDKVAKGAADWATKTESDYVFCGHTHEPIEKVFNIETSKGSHRAVHYFNTGSWVRTPSTFVAIEESGKVSLEEWN